MYKIKYIICLLFSLTLVSNNLAQCVVDIEAGFYHNIVKKADGSLWVFGSGLNSELGNNLLNDSNVPILLTPQTNWQKIIADGFCTLAINNQGKLWVAGYNGYGGLGVGTTLSNIPTFQQVGTAANWKEVQTNRFFSIAVKTDNTLWGWGQNNYYQMGNNTCCSDQLSPIQIGTATDWKTVTVPGGDSAFAIKNNGTLWAWGINTSGFLGNNATTTFSTPVQRSPDTDWASLSGGRTHILAQKTNGTLWSWGDYDEGATANDGFRCAYYDPCQVSADTWLTYSAGFRMSFGIKTNGTLWAWGQNDMGQLGIGITANKFEPVQIGSDNNWVKVSAGEFHAIALKSDGSLWVWGDNSAGQFGNGTNTNAVVPLYIPFPNCTLSSQEFNLNNKSLVVTPNPSKGNTTINYLTSSKPTIAIYSVLGVLQKTYNADNNEGSWNIATNDLPTGLYIVVLKDQEKIVAQQKLIIE